MMEYALSVSIELLNDTQEAVGPISHLDSMESDSS